MNIKHLLFFIVLGILIFSFSKCDGTQTIEKKIIIQDTIPLTQTWEKVVPHQKIPEGLASISSESCGACHQNHYKEWKLSTHANAWTDLQFQAELKKESSPFLCINCHIPLQNQQEFVVSGLIDGDIYKPVKTKNPHFDKALQQEGINCASCHVRDGYIIGPTGTLKAPHKTKKDAIHLSEQLCISCHNANAVVTPTLACTFETADEWKAGPYYGKETCITCHMPEVSREIVSGFGERKSRQHYFMGSGIPKHIDLETKMLNGLTYNYIELAKAINVNSELHFNFTVKNSNAGHRVPTGDPERFILIEFTLIDEQNHVVANQTERIGEHWEWYPEAKKMSDNNLNPLEERAYLFNPVLTKKGKYNLKISVTKHRMDKKTAEYNKLGEEYPLFISIFEKQIEFVVK